MNYTLFIAALVVIVGVGFGIYSIAKKGKKETPEQIVIELGDDLINILSKAIDIVKTDIKSFSSYDDYKKKITELASSFIVAELLKANPNATKLFNAQALEDAVTIGLIEFADKLKVEDTYVSAKTSQEIEKTKDTVIDDKNINPIPASENPLIEKEPAEQPSADIPTVIPKPNPEPVITPAPEAENPLVEAEPVETKTAEADLQNEVETTAPDDITHEPITTPEVETPSVDNDPDSDSPTGSSTLAYEVVPIVSAPDEPSIAEDTKSNDIITK